MIDPKLRIAIESSTKEILAIVQNPNKHAIQNKFILIKLIGSTILGLDIAIKLYQKYLPSCYKNPTPLYDALRAEREELDQWRKTL